MLHTYMICVKMEHVFICYIISYINTQTLSPPIWVMAELFRSSIGQLLIREGAMSGNPPPQSPHRPGTPISLWQHVGQSQGVGQYPRVWP